MNRVPLCRCAREVSRLATPLAYGPDSPSLPAGRCSLHHSANPAHAR